ncbi:hypothetical protein ACRAWF_35430 [Streptomyces sp. L7]
MTADSWTRAVRQQLGLGRLLPLGDRRDGAWIAERAAEVVLPGRVAGQVRGVRLGVLRLAPRRSGGRARARRTATAGALPPGPLRITADFAAVAIEPPSGDRVQAAHGAGEGLGGAARAGGDGGRSTSDSLAGPYGRR